jgi:hypothetical protein
VITKKARTDSPGSACCEARTRSTEVRPPRYASVRASVTSPPSTSPVQFALLSPGSAPMIGHGRPYPGPVSRAGERDECKRLDGHSSESPGPDPRRLSYPPEQSRRPGSVPYDRFLDWPRNTGMASIWVPLFVAGGALAIASVHDRGLLALGLPILAVGSPPLSEGLRRGSSRGSDRATCVVNETSPRRAGSWPRDSHELDVHRVGMLGHPIGGRQ